MNPPRTRLVLVVDDDDALRRNIVRQLKQLGCQVLDADRVASGKGMLQKQAVDVLLTDYELPDGTGGDLTRWALAERRAGVVYCITGFASCANVVEAMKAGCTGVLEKPIEPEQLKTLIRVGQPVAADDLEKWRMQYALRAVGDHPAFLDALRMIRNVADTECTVLITGESGTGKELLARAIHDASPRATRPFVAVNCAAIPENLIESELFGHARGAFTGAVAAREGHIAAAHAGTLFLDEIGDMPLGAQAKLLRVLQERTIQPVGSTRPVEVDIRVVAATHRALDVMTEAGTFREDLYYRLNVVPVPLPALRDRASDIPLLARSILRQRAEKLRRPVEGFEAAAELALASYHWPGNIRELTNVVERAIIACGSGLVAVEDLKMATRSPAQRPGRDGGLSALLARGEQVNLKVALEDLERQLLTAALERCKGNRTEAAALLGVNRTTLVEKLRRLYDGPL